MINRAGQVIGVVFGAAVDDNDTGFVATTDEVSRQLAKIGNTAKVPPGPACQRVIGYRADWLQGLRFRALRKRCSCALTSAGASSWA